MTVAVDTNVIGYAVAGTAQSARRATRALERAAAHATSLILCAAVYAELLAIPRWGWSEVETFLAETGLRVDWTLPPEVWQAAGAAFGRYTERRSRRKEPAPRRILADFLIGSHACTVGRLLTADGRFYRSNFPDLKIVDI